MYRLQVFDRQDGRQVLVRNRDDQAARLLVTLDQPLGFRPGRDGRISNNDQLAEEELPVDSGGGHGRLQPALKGDGVGMEDRPETVMPLQSLPRMVDQPQASVQAGVLPVSGKFRIDDRIDVVGGRVLVNEALDRALQQPRPATVLFVGIHESQRGRNVLENFEFLIDGRELVFFDRRLGDGFRGGRRTIRVPSRVRAAGRPRGARCIS